MTFKFATARDRKRAGAGKVALIALAFASIGTAGVMMTGTAALAGNAEKTENSDINWVAAAPGRVEPKSGQIRIGAGILGRIVEVPVKVNDLVEEGELLVRLDDDEVRARLAAAEAEASSRKRERDAQTQNSDREDVRKAEDAVFSAERALTNSRFELEYELAARRGGNGSDQRLRDARKSLSDAKDRLQRERLAFATAQSKKDVPAPSRLESALSAARSDVAVAESLLDKTRIRAPNKGTVLQLQAKVGEMVAPSPDQTLAVIGDMSVVRVKAELDEQDIAKVKVGQTAFVRSSAYPGRDFAGRVSEIAPSLASPRITQRGARRPTDVEVLEVTIDLEGSPPLLPGMRTDAFFK